VIGIGIAVFALTAVDSALATHRLWLYLLGSMMTMILGVQLFTSWIIITLLADLRERGIE
ncbi:MAG: hypothetical protein KAG66_05150, partial [Methylococcales bacterium]|nr:hypothetical protein [Methylococcales bacterium]